jgi:hypothetical protein
MCEMKNITLSVVENDLKPVRRCAAEHDSPVNRLAREFPASVSEREARARDSRLRIRQLSRAALLPTVEPCITARHQPSWRASTAWPSCLNSTWNPTELFAQRVGSGSTRQQGPGREDFVNSGQEVPSSAGLRAPHHGVDGAKLIVCQHGLAGRMPQFTRDLGGPLRRVESGAALLS